MTKDQATSIYVRVESAMRALSNASALIEPHDEGTVDQEIAESIEEAQQATATAYAALKNIINA